MINEDKPNSIKIGKSAFLLSAGIIFSLMIFSGILTLIVPAGSYVRETIDGRTLVVNGSYAEVEKPDYPPWRWFTAPIEILFGKDNLTPIVLVIFITAVGGSISVLECAGVMEGLVLFLVSRFSRRKYFLIAVLCFFFMVIASFVGIYEGMVPMIIFIVPIAVSLGWDSLTGLGMSLLPLSFGFAAAVTNPFSIAVAQKIADLPLFSGSAFRLIFFCVIYLLVVFFVTRHAKKVEASPELSLTFKEDEAIRQRLKLSGASGKKNISGKQLKALIWFASCIATALLVVIFTARSSKLSALAFPAMAALFLAGGLAGGAIAGLPLKKVFGGFLKGAINFIPGAVLLLMAYSVKHIISTALIMDTILYRAAELIRASPPMTAAFLIYAVTLGMNFFIGSASAKAFLMMPLLVPLADLTGITRQTAVLAFDFGDGFSNMVFPTNALLLIGLSFTVVGYTKWMRWTWKLQLAIIALTSVFLAIAVKIRFGPF